jgi:hypothetical protein
MKHNLMLVLLVLLAAAIAAPARAAEWIYVYRDGCPVGYVVGTGFEFYSVDPDEIAQANRELIGELTGYGPHRAAVGAGAALNGRSALAAEHYAPRPDGPNVSGLSIRDYLSPGDWQAVYGDYFGKRSYYAELDKSGTHWSWDSTTFDTAGHAYGLDSDAQGLPLYSRGSRERYMTDFTWRRGSMEGTTFNIRGLTYETNLRDAGPQPVDVKLRRLESGFRAVEHGYGVEGSAFGGKYISNRLSMDNTFYGGKLQAEHWINPHLGLFADAKLANYDLGLQNATVTRGNMGGEMALDWGGARLSGFARRLDEDSPIAANSNTRGYSDMGVFLDYRAGARGALTATYSKRDVDTERLRIEDDPAQAMLFAALPSRSDFAPYREASSASGEKLDLRGRLELTDGLNLHAAYAEDNWSSLPPVGNFISPDPQPSYLSDGRRAASAELVYNMACNGRLSLRTEETRRENESRQSRFSRVSHAFGYSAALCKQVRWGVGLSRNETQLDLTGDTQDWDADSWDYDVMLAGRASLGDYRLNCRRHSVDGVLGGDYDSLGLELTLKRLPVHFAAWWRQRSDALGGFASFDDLGVNVGYQISVR